MSKNTSKLVSIERAIEIMEIYGANKDRWPEEERAAAIALVTGSDDLQHKLHSEQELDNWLGSPVTTTSVELSYSENQLLTNIIDKLPEQKGKNSAIPAQQHLGQWSSFGAGALAASLFIAVVTFFTLHDTSTLTNSAGKQNIVQYKEVDEWFWEDVTADDTQLDEESPESISFMSLVDLES